MSAAALFSLVLFVLTYVLMFTLQRIRPWVSLASAVIFVSVGSLGLIPGFSYTLPDALREVDCETALQSLRRGRGRTLKSGGACVGRTQCGSGRESAPFFG